MISKFIYIQPDIQQNITKIHDELFFALYLNHMKSKYDNIVVLLNIIVSKKRCALFLLIRKCISIIKRQSDRSLNAAVLDELIKPML